MLSYGEKPSSIAARAASGTSTLAPTQRSDPANPRGIHHPARFVAVITIRRPPRRSSGERTASSGGAAHYSSRNRVSSKHELLEHRRFRVRAEGGDEHRLRVTVRAAQTEHDRFVIGITCALEPVDPIDQRALDRARLRARPAPDAAVGMHRDRRGVSLRLEQLHRREHGQRCAHCRVICRRAHSCHPSVTAGSASTRSRNATVDPAVSCAEFPHRDARSSVESPRLHRVAGTDVAFARRSAGTCRSAPRSRTRRRNRRHPSGCRA